MTSLSVDFQSVHVLASDKCVHQCGDGCNGIDVNQTDSGGLVVVVVVVVVVIMLSMWCV